MGFILIINIPHNSRILGMHNWGGGGGGQVVIKK